MLDSADVRKLPEIRLPRLPLQSDHFGWFGAEIHNASAVHKVGYRFGMVNRNLQETRSRLGRRNEWLCGHSLNGHASLRRGATFHGGKYAMQTQYASLETLSGSITGNGETDRFSAKSGHSMLAESSTGTRE